jgi:GNAT superfamily N-acetyltransferase
MSATIRPLEARDLEAADRVMRLAFGTFLGVTDPLTTFGDVDFVRSRFAAEPGWAFAAELDGELIGSNFVTRWGSFGFFGPLTVRPDRWDRGVGQPLIARAVDLFDAWSLRQAALFTFPQSAKHIALYQKFGFWPQSLTPVMVKPSAPVADAVDATTYTTLAAGERQTTLDDCRALTDAIFAGLDVGHEIRATNALQLGDTVLLHDGSALAAFAVCHIGAGEAGSGTCYVKFGAARPGPGAGERFTRLLAACEATAHARGMDRIELGVNVARHDAYRRILARGYRTMRQGVIMQRPNEPGTCRPDAFVIDDLR